MLGHGRSVSARFSRLWYFRTA